MAVRARGARSGATAQTLLKKMTHFFAGRERGSLDFLLL